MSGHDIVTLGASSGGLEALKTFFESVAPALPVSFFVASHVPGHHRSHLPQILEQCGPYRAGFAEHGAEIRPGYIHIAPPDLHLMFDDGRIRLSAGPRENFWRPSIDVLFRAAAVAHGPRVIGIVLSGTLDDGSAGLGAIVQCGGRAYVQDFNEAAYPEMPESAARNVASAEVLRVGEIAARVSRLAGEAPMHPRPPVPKELRMEVRIAEGEAAAAEESMTVGEATPLTCPDCGGPLRRQPGGESRYRCHVGHAFGPQTLMDGTQKQTESSLWSAIRQFQQRSNLNRSMAERERQLGRNRGAEIYEKRAAEGEEHAAVLRSLLTRLAQ